MAEPKNFDPLLLRTFLAVANGLSFTRAAEQLGISQPTVSQHVRRLEETAGRQLVRRDTRTVSLTDNGEAMAGFARTILAANDEAVSYFTGSAMSGRLRFGAADELALSELPTILREFRQLYPRINLELTVTQSGTLARRLAANSPRSDLHQPAGRLGARAAGPPGSAGLGGHRPGPGRARSNRSRSSPTTRRASADRPRSPPWRRAGRTWRITCNTREINGVLAAARAGIGDLRAGLEPGAGRSAGADRAVRAAARCRTWRWR